MRLFYGWWVAAVSVVVLVGTLPGQTVVVSVFIPRIRDALDLSATEVSLSYMVATIAASLGMTMLGRFSDRYGPRRVTIAAVFVMGLACAFMGVVSSVGALTIGFFGLRAFGQGAMGLLSGHAVALWFEADLRRVEALRAAAMSLATALMPGVAFTAIEVLGWRWAYPALGAGVVLACVPVLLTVKADVPEALGLSIDGRPRPEGAEATALEGVDLPDAVRTLAYWVLLLIGAVHSGLGTALLFHAEALAAAAQVPDPAQSAAQALSVFGFASLGATFFVFALGRRLAYRPALAVVLLLLGASVSTVAVARSAPALLVGYAVLGVGIAILSAALVPCLAAAFGRRHHGAIRGSTMTAMIGGTAIGPVALATCRDVLGSFRPGLLATLPLLAVLIFGLTRVRTPRG